MDNKISKITTEEFALLLKKRRDNLVYFDKSTDKYYRSINPIGSKTLKASMRRRYTK